MHGSALLHARKLLDLLEVEEGMRLADFGIGTTGHIVFPASQYVGTTGRVYAVDVAKRHLHMLSNLCALHGICNIFPVWGDYEREGGVRIPEELDMVLFVNGLSGLGEKAVFANEVQRVLKPHGKLVMVDWKRHALHPVAPRHERRIGIQEAELMLAKLGFRKVADVPVSHTHWGMVLQRAS